MQTVTSKDGTAIAYDRTGRGPALVLVAGAFSFRKFSGQVALAERLAERFTVYNYDRRGRGDSGDAPSYAAEREIEDLEALIRAAGGEACVYGLSSGAALALQAAAQGVPMTKLALHEPPFIVDPADPKPPTDFVPQVQRLIADGRREEAIRYFMTKGMGAPAFVPAMLRLMRGTWRNLTAVAHTLPYDAALLEPYMAGKPLDGKPWSGVRMPTLVLEGAESPASLRHAARALAETLPNAKLLSRKGLGHTKKLDAKRIAEALIDFFAPGAAAPAGAGARGATAAK